MAKQVAKFIVNGLEHELLVEPHQTLLGLLRNQLGLFGTKPGCGTADCGACTVLVDSRPVLSCSTLALTVREKNIVTIEGLADGNRLHPIQQAFVDHGAVQCGYCTPGMILSAKALLDEIPHPTEEEVRHGLVGNLCRCTGYVKIVEAVISAAEVIGKGGV